MSDGGCVVFATCNSNGVIVYGGYNDVFDDSNGRCGVGDEPSRKRNGGKIARILNLYRCRGRLYARWAIQFGSTRSVG
jgi:hypothetical protein